MKFIPYGRQCIDESDISAVVECLKSDFLTQGPIIKEFEDAISSYTGAKYAIVVANATTGLHIAIKALDIDKGMEGITSPNTFVASSNSLIYNDLIPIFADINKDSYNICNSEIKKRITKKTKIIIPVHFAGNTCDMKDIKNIADENKLYIIEDAAHAIGSNYEDGTKVGNCKYSDMTVFSFHPVKTMTTGEGGAITTNNRLLYEKLLMLRSHGITREESKINQNPGPWYYEMQELGFNYRMTDIQAALGISQLNKLEKFKLRRLEIVNKYQESFYNIKWIKNPKIDNNNCYHLNVVQIDFGKIGKTRKKIMESLKTNGIGTQVHYIPVHTQPYYMKKYGYKSGDFPIAESYYEKALSLPLYPMMTDTDVDYVIENIKGLQT